ncbi:MAG: hypothetical protein AAGA46_00485 [Cyanobacteria bacterium P01_F01_bin.13]
MPFTDADKTQLWELFSNDTDDLDDSSGFMRAIAAFEQEDLDHPTFNLVAGIQANLAALTTLDTSIATASSNVGTREEDFDDQVRLVTDGGLTQINNLAAQRSALKAEINKRLKFSSYGVAKRSKVIGVQPMLNYSRGYVSG